jgi:hypothetical protein
MVSIQRKTKCATVDFTFTLTHRLKILSLICTDTQERYPEEAMTTDSKMNLGFLMRKKLFQKRFKEITEVFS